MRSPSPLGDFNPKGTFKCLRRILLCAWSTRHRICFLIRRALCFVSSRTRRRLRCEASVPVLLSRTGSSSFAIRACGISAYVDSLTRAPPSIASATMRGSGLNFRSLSARIAHLISSWLLPIARRLTSSVDSWQRFAKIFLYSASGMRPTVARRSSSFCRIFDRKRFPGSRPCAHPLCAVALRLACSRVVEARRDSVVQIGEDLRIRFALRRERLEDREHTLLEGRIVIGVLHQQPGVLVGLSPKSLIVNHG